MKKWNNPELLSLGVENTFEQDVFAQDKNHHPCHKNGASEQHSGHHNGKGFKANVTCPTNEHTDLYYDDKLRMHYTCCSHTGEVPVS